MSKSLKYIAAGSVLTVALVDDQTEETLRKLVIDVADVPDTLKNGDTQESVKLYGIRKLLQERSSSEKDTDEKFESMLETAEILKSGLWKSDETRTRVPQIDPIFAQAVANVKSAPLAKVIAALQSLDKDGRDALRKHPAIVAEVDRLKAEASAEAGEGALDLSL